MKGFRNITEDATGHEVISVTIVVPPRALLVIERGPRGYSIEYLTDGTETDGYIEDLDIPEDLEAHFQEYLRNFLYGFHGLKDGLAHVGLFSTSHDAVEGSMSRHPSNHPRLFTGNGDD